MHFRFKANPYGKILALGATSLWFSACQQESVTTPTHRDAIAYASAVQKLKLGPADEYDRRLRALDEEFGFGSGSPAAVVDAEPAGEDAPRPGIKAAQAKAAATRVLYQSGTVVNVHKTLLKLVKGEYVVLIAESINLYGTGYSDPVGMLIQFNDPDFIANGIIPPKTAMADFTIKGWADDTSGALTSWIDYKAQNEQPEYFLYVVYPYNNENASRYTDIYMGKYGSGYVRYPGGKRMIGGMVFQSMGANDFRATRESNSGDPSLYVIRVGRKTGMYNDDKYQGTFDSKVYPYTTPTSENSEKNMILIDNLETLTTTDVFRHTQYAP